MDSCSSGRDVAPSGEIGRKAKYAIFDFSVATTVIAVKVLLNAQRKMREKDENLVPVSWIDAETGGLHASSTHG